MNNNALLSANIFRQFTHHIKVVSWVVVRGRAGAGGGGRGNRVNKTKIAEKIMQKKKDFILFSKHQLYQVVQRNTEGLKLPTVVYYRVERDG